MKKAKNNNEMTAIVVLAYLIDEIKRAIKGQGSEGYYGGEHEGTASDITTYKEAFDYVVGNFYECPSYLYYNDAEIEIKKHYSYEQVYQYMKKAVIEPFPVIPQPIREQAYAFWYERAQLKKLTAPDAKALKKLKAALKAVPDEQA